MHSAFRSRQCFTTALLSAAALLCVPLSATAQIPAPKEPKWTLEAFGGYGFSPSVPGGQASVQFPAGDTFTTEGGFTSRSNPSWYFGDGATLFNQVAAQFGSQFNIQIPRIVPLDAALGAAGRKEQSGTRFGARVTRRLTSRFSLEIGFERSEASVDLADSVRSAIEESRATFESGFSALLMTVPMTALQVSSAAELPSDVTASRTIVTGALNIALARSGPFGAHLSAGVGRAAHSGGTLEARLRGNYRFRFFDVNPINESDVVTIRFEERENATIGVFGGGFTYDVAARHGVRLDVRVHAGRSGQTTTVQAAPSVLPSLPAIALPSITNPSIQFSNTNALPSSLAGPGTTLQTFTADSLEVRPHVTVSYFVRF